MSHEEFRILYDKYHEFSARIIYRIVKNRTVTDDLSNDVFYRIFEMGDYLDVSDEKKLRSCIAVMSKNCALDYFKKSHVIHEQFTMDDDENWEQIPDDRYVPEEQILHMEKTAYQKMVLARLREKNQLNYDIMMKVKYMEISPDDVAKEYGMTRNNINNRILRTKNWLAEELKKCYKI